MKIAPVQDETSTGLSCLNDPDAIRFIDNYNKDLSIESETVLQMDNIVHMHTDSEEAMITSALRLITGMEMKGPIPFKNFKTTFSTAYFLKGVFNPREGDIYAMASYTARGQHSRVAERLASWYHECKNLAFAKRHQPRNDCSDCLEAELRKVDIDESLYVSVAMRELLPRFSWLRVLLHEISLNQVKVAPTVTTPLSDLKDPDAINLGKGLSAIILGNTEASAAVDHWISQNKALGEFEKEYAWMRPFFVELAQYNLNTSNFGLKLRVFGGAVLSTIDLITDLYTTVQFFTTDGQDGYGRINAWLIGLTMFWQIFMAYVQNRKKPSHFFRDTIFILVGFKPALDA